MSKILKSSVIKRGNLIDNYLANFPQFINKEKNSIYKLIIGQNLTCFIIKTPNEELFPTNGFTIRLPYYQFNQNHAQYISWGDDVTKRGDTSQFLEHTYKEPNKTYQIYILGDTPNLYSISNKPTTVSEYENNFKQSLIEIKKLCDNLTDLHAIFKNYPNLSGIPDETLPSQVEDCAELFYGCTNIEYIPFNFNLPEEGVTFENMFAFTSLKNIFNQNLRLPYKTSNVNGMFRDTKIESVPEKLFDNVTSSLTTTNSMFYDCKNLLYFTSTKKLDYITNIDIMFQFCQSLKEIKFNVPNLTSLFATCWGCSSLNRVEGIHINEFTKNANYSFYDCVSLNQDVGQILEYWTDFNLVNITSTFYNCAQLRGTPKEQYLWKSYSLGHLNTNMFYNCTLLTNYNFITSGWGGADDVNYWYGSFEITIENPEEDIFCLPIFKFLYGDNTSEQNLKYNILEPTEEIIAPYDFYINYGEDGAWEHVIIGNTTFFDNLWQNDKNSIFFGYPKTYQVNFKNKYKNENGKFDLQTNKLQTYENLVNNSFYGFIYQHIMHIYKSSGNYKIMILGRLPRLYVHHEDLETNRLLFNIYTVNKLPFTTLDHAFTNAINLRYLPNEDLTKFPILTGQSNWENVQSTFVSADIQYPLYKDEQNNIVIYLGENVWKQRITDEEWIPYDTTSVDVRTFKPITYVTLYSLERDDLLHNITSTDTNYTFAHVYGYNDYIEMKPSLFNIESNETTFLNRNVK